MEIKSYYFKRNQIVIRDFDNNKTILELNRTNLNKMITSMNKQIKTNLGDIEKKEDILYKKYINILGILTMFEGVSVFMTFFGFVTANYFALILGLLSTFLLIGYTAFIAFEGIKALRKINVEHKMYEGREILIDKYNSLNKVSKKSLVDVY